MKNTIEDIATKSDTRPLTESAPPPLVSGDLAAAVTRAESETHALAQARMASEAEKAAPAPTDTYGMD